MTGPFFICSGVLISRWPKPLKINNLDEFSGLKKGNYSPGWPIGDFRHSGSKFMPSCTNLVPRAQRAYVFDRFDHVEELAAAASQVKSSQRDRYAPAEYPEPSA